MALHSIFKDTLYLVEMALKVRLLLIIALKNNYITLYL